MIVCISAQAQVLTDWQLSGLQGKVKRCVEVEVYPEVEIRTEEGEVYIDKEGRLKTISDYDKDGFLVVEVRYSARDFKSESDYVFLSKSVYSKYVDNRREMISYEEDGTERVCADYTWKVLENGRTKERTRTYRNAEKNDIHSCKITIYDENNREISEDYISHIHQSYETVDRTISKYNAEGDYIGYISGRVDNDELKNTEQLDAKFTNYDQQGNATKCITTVDGVVDREVYYIMEYYE